MEDGTVADDHLKFTEFSLDELIEIIRQGLSDNSTAQTIERMKQAEQRQKDEIYKTWKKSEEYAQRKQQLLKMIAKNNVIPGIAKDKVNMRLFLDVISVAVQIVDNDPEVVIPDLEWLQHHKSRYGSLWMINQSYSDENAQKKLGARKKLWSGIGAIAQSSEQEQRETFLDVDGYAKFGGNSIEFVENYAELRLPIQGDAVRFCLYQSRYSNETKTDKLFKIYEKLLEREIPVSLTFDDNAFIRSYLRLRNDDPEIAEIAQNADKPVVAPLEPIGYTSPVDAFVDIILGRNLEQRRDLRQQIIEKRGTDNIVRGNIRKELDVIRTQLGVEKISLDELRNALVKEAKKNTLAGRHRDAVTCYFHALRCVPCDESIQSYTQYLIHGDEHLEIRRGLLEALRNSVAAMPQKGVTAFQTMWASPNPPIEEFLGWAQQYTNLPDLDFFVDSGDAFWAGNSRYDQLKESCKMLSYLSSGSNGFLSEKQVYDYLNSRRVQGTPDLNPQLVAQMWRKYAALNQDRQDPDILKVLFLCNILADYARILLGNDEEDAAEILLPLLQKLQYEKGRR